MPFHYLPTNIRYLFIFSTVSACDPLCGEYGTCTLGADGSTWACVCEAGWSGDACDGVYENYLTLK